MSCRGFGLLPILSLHTLSFIKLSHSFCNVTEINLSLSSSVVNPFIPILRWTDFSPFTNPNPALSASLFLASPTSSSGSSSPAHTAASAHASGICQRATGSSNATKGERCKKKVWAPFQKKSLSWAPSAFPLTPSSLALAAQGPRLLYLPCAHPCARRAPSLSSVASLQVFARFKYDVHELSRCTQTTSSNTHKSLGSLLFFGLCCCSSTQQIFQSLGEHSSGFIPPFQPTAHILTLNRVTNRNPTPWNKCDFFLGCRTTWGSMLK